MGAEWAADTADGERLLADINHELGNYFHKLYYCADAVGDSHHPTRTNGAAAMLGPTLRELDGFLRSAFAHFSPVELRLVPMRVADIATAAARQLSLGDAPALVDPSRLLRVDPGLLSYVVQVIAQRVEGRTTSRPTVSLQVEEARPDGVSFRVAVASPLPRPRSGGVQAGLCWAKARRVAALHGGLLREEEAGAYRIVLSLPG